ncbi:MAG: cupin domain-containing protein [Clostridiales bacterium]|nr:cupin domain-containing protein [Clostridiales bacterium]
MNNENDNTTLGSKLRDLRRKNGLTQEELADRAELSKGFISQLENDLTSPSITTLIDILTLLGSNLSAFFADYDQSQLVFTPEDYFEKQYDDMTVHWIVPTAQKNAMEPIITELKKGAATDEDFPHEGEEFGYVLQGKVKVVVGDRTAEASAGDAFYFSSDKKHYIINIYDGVSRVLWVSCPPSF